MIFDYKFRFDLVSKLVFYLLVVGLHYLYLLLCRDMLDGSHSRIWVDKKY